jgi:hypothetical protein
MGLPPLFKYLDVQGAKLTLGNGSFRHAKPSDFNDIEDMTVQSIFPEETEIALKKLSGGLNDVILAHLNDPPTCASPCVRKLHSFSRRIAPILGPPRWSKLAREAEWELGTFATDKYRSSLTTSRNHYPA